MITTNATIYPRNGEWRYGGGVVMIRCDHPGCIGAVFATGLEHNGAAIECIYLPADCGWRLGTDGDDEERRDLCPDHAPKEPT